MAKMYQSFLAVIFVSSQVSCNPFHFSLWPKTFYQSWYSAPSYSSPYDAFRSHHNLVSGFGGFLRHDIRLPPLQPDLSSSNLVAPPHQQPSHSYGRPQHHQPAPVYGPPQQQQQQPNPVYGPPQQQPNPIYGPPQQQQQQQQPAPIYGVPQQQQPAYLYGQPQQPAFGPSQSPFFGSSSFFQPSFGSISQPQLPSAPFSQVVPLIPRPGPPVFVPRPDLQLPAPTYLPPVTSSPSRPNGYLSVAHDSTTDSVANGNQQIPSLLDDSAEETSQPTKTMPQLAKLKTKLLTSTTTELPTTTVTEEIPMSTLYDVTEAETITTTEPEAVTNESDEGNNTV